MFDDYMLDYNDNLQKMSLEDRKKYYEQREQAKQDQQLLSMLSVITD